MVIGGRLFGFSSEILHGCRAAVTGKETAARRRLWLRLADIVHRTAGDFVFAGNWQLLLAIAREFVSQVGACSERWSARARLAITDAQPCTFEFCGSWCCRMKCIQSWHQRGEVVENGRTSHASITMFGPLGSMQSNFLEVIDSKGSAGPFTQFGTA